MDSANVQVLRRMEELFNRRDLDSYFELVDPEVEWHVSREDPDATVHRGRDAVRGYLEGWINSFADLQIHMEVKDADGDRVLTELRFHGHGTGSGAPMDDLVAFSFLLHHGRVTRVDDLGREGLQPSTK
jgi:ketosteroid isomerase-like protein